MLKGLSSINQATAAKVLGKGYTRRSEGTAENIKMQ
jgi:hypothetical protein